jgi:hypothetical protein
MVEEQDTETPATGTDEVVILNSPVFQRRYEVWDNENDGEID